MELVTQQSVLNRALQLTQNIVEKKNTMPVLVNVLLSTVEGKLSVSATDLEITAVVQAEAKIERSGSVCVNARVFADIVRELPEGEVKLTLKEAGRFEISAQNSTLRMVGVSAEEYPSLPGMAIEPQATLAAQELLRMISKTVYAVSHDETRFNLNGVCFEMVEQSGKSCIRLVATDGHRLAMSTKQLSNFSLDDRIIVPTKGLIELRKVLEDLAGEDVGVAIENGFLVAEGGNTKLSMRLIDGEFPDYHQVIPSDEGEQATIPVVQFANALRRVALMVSDKGKCVKLDFSNNSLHISSSSPELGDANDDIEIGYEGEAISVGFNARYLLDVATSVGDEGPLHLELHGKLGPGRITTPGDSSYVAIVMPMRLPDTE